MTPNEGRSWIGWTFFSNHAHVIILMARSPMIRTRDLAHQIGITERAVQRIIADLVDGAYVSRERIGRRNRYIVHEDRFLRHPVEGDCRIRDLLAAVSPKVD